MKLTRQLAFKISLGVGLLFVYLLLVVHHLFSQTVIYEFETFLEVEHTESPMAPVDPGFKDAVVMELKHAQKDDLQSILAVYAEAPVWILVLDQSQQTVASNLAQPEDIELDLTGGEVSALLPSGDALALTYGGVVPIALSADRSVLLLPMPEDVDTDPEIAFKTSVSSQLWWWLGLALGLGLILTWWLVWGYTRRLAQLTVATQALQSGQLPEPIEISGNDELTALTEHFNLAFANWRKQEQLRQNMVSDVAHELRTPLTHMRGKLEAVLDGLLPCDINAIEQINQEVQYLTRITQDLQDLTLARAGQLKVFPEPCVLAEEVAQILNSYRDRKGSELKTVENLVDSEAQVVTDKTRLKQIIINLLDNAHKHAGPDTQVRIESGSDHGRWTLSVIDNGPGIDGAVLPHIFNRQIRAPKERDHTSMGLGLAIVSQLADLLSLDLTVSSQPGRTEFSLKFPK